MRVVGLGFWGFGFRVLGQVLGFGFYGFGVWGFEFRALGF